MSREDDKRIAEWVGWKPKFTHGKNGKEQLNVMPHYTTSDADAITLLPVLVERGYDINFRNVGEITNTQWELSVYWEEIGNDLIEIIRIKPTIAAAISAAVLQLIEKEGK